MGSGKAKILHIILFLKKSHCSVKKESIENLLKRFIITIAQKYYIKVEEIKGYIHLIDDSKIELIKLEVFLNRDDDKEYKGNIVFKVSEKYKNVQIPEIFNIEGIKGEEKIHIKSCRLSELDYKTKEYKAEFNVNNADFEKEIEKIVF